MKTTLALLDMINQSMMEYVEENEK